MRRGLRLILLLLITASCVDQKDYNLHAVDVKPSVALPLVTGNLTVQNFLSGSDSAFVRIYPDDLVALEYSHPLISTEIRNLFKIPDKTLNQNFLLKPGIIPAHSGDIRTDSITEVMDLGLSPEQLTQIDFKAGTLIHSAQLVPTNASLKFDVIFTSPDLVSRTTGKPLSVNGSNGSIDLADYIITLTKNKFNLNMVLVLKGPAQATVIGANTSVAVKFSMTGMDFNSIHGFFGDQTVYPPPATLNIKAFGNSLHNAHVSFPQAAISLTVINDYGVPCQVDFLTFEVRKDGATLAGQLSPASPITVASPSVLGTSATTQIAVANTSQLIDFGPNSFYYAVSARINKNLVSGNNFLNDTSKLRVNLNVKIPLYGQASKILLSDTAAVDLGKIDGSQVDHASLKVNIVNQLPLDARVQFYLTDDKFKIIDSLLNTAQTSFVKASSVTTAGDLQTAGVSDQLLPLDQDALNKLFTAKHIIIKALLSTSLNAAGNPIDVKFKSKYSMQVNLGLLADLKFNLTF